MAKFLTWDKKVDGVILWNLDDLPVLYVLVTTPRDQSLLHRAVCVKGYVPVLLAAHPDKELWRFHHPDGEKPL